MDSLEKRVELLEELLDETREDVFKLKWWEDLTPPEDFDPYEDCTTNRGKWITECRAKRHHQCVRRSVYCPGEICPGEVYERTAVLERPLGPRKKGTVTVFRACQECMHHA